MRSLCVGLSKIGNRACLVGVDSWACEVATNNYLWNTLLLFVAGLRAETASFQRGWVALGMIALRCGERWSLVPMLHFWDMHSLQTYTCRQHQAAVYFSCSMLSHWLI